MIVAVDPEESPLRDITVLCHMTYSGIVIKGGIVGTQHIWNEMDGCSIRVTEGIDPCG